MRNTIRFFYFVILVCVFVSLNIGQTTQKTIPEQGQPLTNLSKKADGHWSPYQTPTYPEGANVYTIQKGDTLWDLAQKFLKTPYLWPQIWEKNPYITNPHWIYPGDPLLVEEPKLVEKPKVETPVEEAPAPEPEVQPEEKIDRIRDLKSDVPPARPMTLTTEKLETYYSGEEELYGTGRVSATRIAFDTFIVGAEDENTQRYLGEGEIVFLNKGMRQNVYPGAQFQILRPEGSLDNPVTKKFVGFYYMQLGICKVIIAHDNNAIAQITFCSRPVYIGDGLLPYEEKAKIPRDPNHKFQRFIGDNGKPTGNIVYLEERTTIAASGSVVYIDLGKNANLTPGQFCTVYRVEGKYKRDNEFFNIYSTQSLDISKDGGFSKDQKKALANRSIPRIILGELVIIDVYDNAAKAKVINSRQVIDLGNYVQIQ